MTLLGAVRCGAALTCAALLSCQPEVTSVGEWAPLVERDLYLEAESGELTSGFTIASDPRASSGKFIAPPAGVRADTEPGLARARYAFRVPSAGDYVVWGRIYTPNAVNNRFWFQVDGGAWYLWRMSVGEIWFWDDLHDDKQYKEPVSFALSAGPHELLLANAVEGALVDRLYFTAEGDEPPGNETPCAPPHSIEIAGQCLPSCGRLNGTACGATTCQGKPLLEAYDCEVCCRIAAP